MATATAKPRKAKATKAKPTAKAAAKARNTRATRAKAAKATRAKATSSAQYAPTGGRDAAGAVSETAERAVLIPVGAALIARERVVSTVNDTLSTYTSSTKTQAQLKRFERRGVTARKRMEREIRKTRVRVERDLRERRREIENAVAELDDRREAIARNVQDIPTLAGLVQERLQTLV